MNALLSQDRGNDAQDAQDAHLAEVVEVYTESEEECSIEFIGLIQNNNLKRSLGAHHPSCYDEETQSPSNNKKSKREKDEASEFEEDDSKDILQQKINNLSQTLDSNDMKLKKLMKKLETYCDQQNMLLTILERLTRHIKNLSDLADTAVVKLLIDASCRSNSSYNSSSSTPSAASNV